MSVNITIQKTVNRRTRIPSVRDPVHKHNHPGTDGSMHERVDAIERRAAFVEHRGSHAAATMRAHARQCRETLPRKTRERQRDKALAGEEPRAPGVSATVLG